MKQHWLVGLRLAGLGAAYFFASGAFMSYWSVWLNHRGISDIQIGTLYMARQMVSVAAVLGIGFLAHRIGNLRGMLIALSLGAVVMMGAYQLSYTFLALLLVGLVWGAVWSPVLALYDGLLVNESRARGIVYGRLRLWGSVAFIAGTLICGIAVKLQGPPWVLYVALVGILSLTPLALLLPKTETHASGPRHAPFGLLELFKSRRFVLFMIAAGFCQSSHAVLYSFGTLTWRGAGIDDVTISMLWGESVAAEILMMLVSGWMLPRMGVCGLIGFGLCCGVVRWTGMAFTTDVVALVFLQALHAGTFAASHLGAMAFIQRALPASGAALGQSIYYALGTGLTQAVIFQFAGVLYARFGQHAFLGMVAISALGLIAILMLARLWKGELLVGSTASGRAP
ncbi:MAG: MFS transporter [Alphaproteobacteria bacterium]|nr:MFS transporter [Alphaproteobacteria bacterium]